MSGVLKTRILFLACLTTLVGLLLLPCAEDLAWAQAGGFKLFISVDMEGVVGVVTADQLGPDGFEYQRAREWMTGELLAAIEAAREEGVTEFVIADSDLAPSK